MAAIVSFPPPRFNRAVRITPSPYCCVPPPAITATTTAAAAAAAAARSLLAGGGHGDNHGGEIIGGFMIASVSSMLRWHVVDLVGQCLCGEVLRAVDVVRGGCVAIKQMSLEKISSMIKRNSSEDPIKEVGALQFLKATGHHPNVIEVIEVLRDDDYIYVVLPLCGGGEMFHVVSAAGGLSESRARPIFRGLLAGLDFLHRLGICHRDISLENILLTADDQVKIIDFGMALMFGQSQGHHERVSVHSSESSGTGARGGGGGGASSGVNSSTSPVGAVGKKNYVSPEAMYGGEYNGFAADVWACGVSVFIALTGIPPFEVPIPSQDRRCHVIAVERRLLELVRGWKLPLSTEAVSLIQACLIFDPSERPSIQDLSRHCWFAGADQAH